jgi:L-aspartate oxidase
VLPGELRPVGRPDRRPHRGLVAGAVRRDLQEVMTARWACCARRGPRRRAAAARQARRRGADEVDQDAWETTNLLTISAALADAAALREETRGSHWREDFPERDDAAGPGTSTR